MSNDKNKQKINKSSADNVVESEKINKKGVV